jgi:hypothetical protein
MVAVALVALISPAWATPISSFNSTLTEPNAAISGFTGPYGEMTIVLTTATTATVTFTSDTADGNTYLFGNGTSAGVNVNASSFTITGISGSNGGTGFTPGPYTAVNPPGTSNVSEFGLFNGVINSFGGYTHASDTISFTLTNTGGTWASASCPRGECSGVRCRGPHLRVRGHRNRLQRQHRCAGHRIRR